jgi:hypothetical protein
MIVMKTVAMESGSQVPIPLQEQGVVSQTFLVEIYRMMTWFTQGSPQAWLLPIKGWLHPTSDWHLNSLDFITPFKSIESETAQDGKEPTSGAKTSSSEKLKGVIWPGMDLFDSANPEMKRKRNQKKDGHILDEMISNSLGVEPAEISYHPSGEFRASRDIFGPLSDVETSPVGLFNYF